MIKSTLPGTAFWIDIYIYVCMHTDIYIYIQTVHYIVAYEIFT